MYRMKKTKIVATMSDFRCTEEFVKELFDAGMDVVRVNSAHVTEEGATRIVETVHRVNPAIPIMIDTKGPEIRVTTIADEYGNSIHFRAGDRVAVRGSDGSDLTTRKVVYMNVPTIVRDIPVGARMLIADGELEIRVLGKTDEELDCEFIVGGEKVKALRGVSFAIREGEFVTIMGTSGSGKSTLLNILGCLDTPTSGEYILDGVSVQSMSKNQRAVTRNRKIGFVFQNYNLLPKTTAIENVELPLLYNPAVSSRERRERAVRALEAVGLEKRLNHKSNQMSGGQQQRVAIARALVNDPVIILADEATGNLDTRTSFSILMLFQELHARGRTIIFVTHNPELALYSSRNIVLRDGKVVSDTLNPSMASAREAYENLPTDND